MSVEGERQWRQVTGQVMIVLLLWKGLLGESFHDILSSHLLQFIGHSCSDSVFHFLMNNSFIIITTEKQAERQEAEDIRNIPSGNESQWRRPSASITNLSQETGISTDLVVS